ncbi:MAG: pyrroline-5-carboxylate reductase, partial [Gammaproteobacteria bacterium]
MNSSGSSTFPDIAFIGCGNMGCSLIGGLLASGHPADAIHGAEPDAAKREALEQSFGIHLYADNHSAISQAAAVVLAVKPQVLQAVIEPLAADLRAQQPLLLSVAAGIPITALQRWLAASLAVVRAMPNTPALIQTGMTGLYASPEVAPAQRQLADNILKSVGATVWLDDEALLDVVTAISGSGPAYFFLFIEALAEAGEQLGLDADTARQLALQTGYGATRMA